jgi:hypothetical protein
VTAPAPGLPWTAVSTRGLMSKIGTVQCLDFGGADGLAAAAGATVGLSACGPGDGSVRADTSQRWVYRQTDVSLRPFGNGSLCLTNHVYDGGRYARLAAY